MRSMCSYWSTMFRPLSPTCRSFVPRSFGQDVRDAFNSDVAAFNQVIFDSVNAAGEVEATDLKVDVDLMVQNCRKTCLTRRRGVISRSMPIGARSIGRGDLEFV